LSLSAVHYCKCTKANFLQTNKLNHIQHSQGFFYMKNTIKWALIILGSLAAVYIIGGIVIPKEWSVVETTSINAPYEAIYEQIADLKNWQAWSPWKKEVDESQVNTYEGETLGVGQKLSWVSQKMGQGWLKITTAHPESGIGYELFIDMNGHQSTILGEITYIKTDAGLDVTWKDLGNSGNNLIKRWMSLFIKPKLAKQLKEGLLNLKHNLETMKPQEKIEQPTDEPVEKTPEESEAPQQ
jgi:hypothetical protein